MERPQRYYLIGQGLLLFFQALDVITTVYALNHGLTADKNDLWNPIIRDFGPTGFAIARSTAAIIFQTGIEILRRKKIVNNTIMPYILIGANLSAADRSLGNVITLLSGYPLK